MKQNYHDFSYKELETKWFNFSLIYKRKNWDEIDRFLLNTTKEEIEFFINKDTTKKNFILLTNEVKPYKKDPVYLIEEIKERINFLKEYKNKNL